MAGPMQYHQPENPHMKEKPSRSQGLMRILGVVFLLAFLIYAVYSVYRLGQRDASQIPVIAANDLTIRSAPEDPQGTKLETERLEVSGVIEGNEASLAGDVNLLNEEGEDLSQIAPPQNDMLSDIAQGLAEQDASDAEDTALEVVVPVASDAPMIDAPKARPATLYILPKDKLDPRTAEAQPVFNPAPTEDNGNASGEGNVQIAQNSGENTQSPYSDEGINPAQLPQIDPPKIEANAQDVPQTPQDNPADNDQNSPSVYIDPNSGEDIGPRLPVGTPIIQLGSNPDINVTRRQWEEISAANQDILGDKSLYIETTLFGGRIYYRVRVQGFQSREETQTACTALLVRGQDCFIGLSE